MVRARQDKLDSLDNKDLDELDELEDIEDDQILNQYRLVWNSFTMLALPNLNFRHKRMMEMQALAAKEKYGEVSEISKPDFIREVSEASKECYVVVHLYKD